MKATVYQPGNPLGYAGAREVQLPAFVSETSPFLTERHVEYEPFLHQLSDEEFYQVSVAASYSIVAGHTTDELPASID